MSGLFYAIGYILFIGFLPLIYVFCRSITQGFRNKKFYQSFLKDFIRTFPACGLVALPLFVFPTITNTYMIIIHLVFVPLMFIELGHIYLFKTRIGMNTFFTFFVSNVKETKEFLTQNIPSVLFIVAPIFILLPIWFLVKIPDISLSVSTQTVGISICALLTVKFVRNLFKSGFKFKDGYILNPYSNILYHFYLYKKTYTAMKETLAKNTAEPFKNIQKENETNEPETYVVIIGESANRTHLSLYGYSRETCPFLKQMENELLVFKNVVSPFAQTMPVLERVLTFADAEHPEYLTTKGSVIDFFNQSGFKTYWLSNQYALTDTSVSAISSHAQWEKSYNFSGMKRFEKTGFDGDMLPDIQRILLDTSVDKKVVFIHLIGSHSAYTNRYPAEFAHFKDKMPHKDLTDSGHTLLNEYDDSIRYTDYVVHQIASIVKSLNQRAYCLYFSDHGEDIFDTTNRKILGHSELANEPMTSIPCILWTSEKYQSELSDIYNRMRQQIDTPYNSQDIIHFILTAAGLKNEDIMREKSLG